MKRRDYLVALLKKSGLKADETEPFLSDLEADIEDSEASTRLSGLLTVDEALASDAIYNKVKGRAKSEALDPIDQELAPLEEALPATLKADYKAIGKSSYDRVKFLVKHFPEIAQKAEKTGNANYDELKATYDDLKSRLGTEYVEKSKYSELESTLNQVRREAVESRIVNAGRGLIRNEDAIKHRHFARNFLQDLNDLLSEGIGENKVKGQIDYATGKIMRADSPDQPLLIDGEVATLEALAAQVVAFGEYDKGYQPPKSDNIRVPLKDQGERPVSEAARRNAEFDKQGM